MSEPLPADPVVAILLSTFNGAPFLQEQLDSFVAQDGVGWRLYWRDDGSSDESAGLVRQFGDRAGAGRCVEVEAPSHRGVAGSYMTLLRAAAADGASVAAFADQDDVWLPRKLIRGLSQLGADPAAALYCCRQVLVGPALERLGESAPFRVVPGLGPALTQNIATGCTVMLNRAAVTLVAQSVPPPPSMHDWWSYLVVAGAGGRIVADEAATVLYRQHGGNAVGAPPSRGRRAAAALRRGPGAFMTVMRAQVGALRGQPGLLSPASREVVEAVGKALAGGTAGRLRVLWRFGLLRQTAAETWLFRCWFLLG